LKQQPLTPFDDAWQKLTKSLELSYSELKDQEKQIKSFIKLLVETKKDDGSIFLIGAGRSANILNFFMTRLIQLGFSEKNLSLVTEEKIPLLDPEKTLVICLSGTGLTEPAISYAVEYAKSKTLTIFITGNRHENNLKSPLFDYANIVIYIPGISEYDLSHKKEKPRAYGKDQIIKFNLVPGPSLFECSAIFFLEAVISVLNKIKEADWMVIEGM
jgi:D-arabinose 5-phosphate isomerase GutQ